jgi:hypothetical protein
MEFVVHGISLELAIIGLVELAKRAGLPDRFAPLLALALGIGAGFVYYGPAPRQSLLYGVVMGLTASGLYSGCKALLLGDEEERVRARIEQELGGRIIGEQQ